MGSKIGKPKNESGCEDHSQHSESNQSEDAGHNNTALQEISQGLDSDPRSPNSCRTPFNAKPPPNLITRPIKRVDLSDSLKSKESTSTPNLLKARLLKNLGYTINLLDPRSPTSLFSRTPILFTDSDECIDTPIKETINLDRSIDESECLDNTFADLMIENSAHESDFGTPSAAIEFPLLVDPLDPRSPSENIERTPLVLAKENADGLKEVICAENTPIRAVEPVENRLLDRVKYGKLKFVPKVTKKLVAAPSESPSALNCSIYEDSEQVFSQIPNTFESEKIPEKKADVEDEADKRTPLKCVGNRPHIRSKSAEILEKSKNPKQLKPSYREGMPGVHNARAKKQVLSTVANENTNSKISVKNI